MKPNFTKQLKNNKIKTIDDAEKSLSILYGHVQLLTDTLVEILDGGLSLNSTENNLPLVLVRSRVVSGVPKVVSGNGAAIVFVSDNAIVERYAYRQISNNTIEVTVSFDDDSVHDVVFLTVTQKLP